MKLLLIFASVVLAINAASDKDLWLEFKQNHGKSYKSLREERLRFGIFQDNLRKIESHNLKHETGEVSYTLGVNQFADLTQEEFSNWLKKGYSKKPVIESTLFEPNLNLTVPDSIDWRDQGAVLEVKDQGQCGSCWAFSTTGSIEGQNAIVNGKKISLSEQNLVDCSSSYGNDGCDGGLMTYGFDYVKDHGIESEADYPYKGRDGTCQFASSKSVLKVSGFKEIKERSESDLKSAVGTVGPVAVAVNGDLMQLYSSGIFDNLLCLANLDHGVLAVGYDHANNKDYWIVKNSWGAQWGEKGYIRMRRNRFNQCGIASEASYPVL